MKNFVLLLVCCVISAQAIGPKRQSDREHEGFVGPVKKVAAIWMPISGRNYPEGSRCRQLTNEYDRMGRITRHSVYPGTCGEDEIREDYTYSSAGDKTTKRQEIRGANRPPPPPPAFNPSNVKRESGPAKEARKHDDAGRLMERSMVLPSGTLSHKTTYTYDGKGRLIESAGYDGDDRLTVRRVNKYSGDQRVPFEFTYYGRDGKVYERTTYTDYEFNSKGDWIKRKQTTEKTFNRRTVSITYREIEYYPDNN